MTDIEVSIDSRKPPRALTAARRGGRALARRLAITAATARRAWRRSLQLRMVTITLLVSSLLVGAFGYLVVALTTDGALDRARTGAQQQVERGTEHARDQLSFHIQPGDTGLPNTMRAVVNSQSEGGRLVALVPPPSVASDAVTTRGVGVTDTVSSELAAEVAAGNVASQIVTDQLEAGAPAVTYLVYGAPVPPGWADGEPFHLYHFTPLTAETEAAADIRNTVLATGVALVLLLAVVTGLVTRLVVRPVRVAARTAQRLSAGLLDQRMTVEGEDDLALLAASFNQMAANLQRQIVRLEEMSRQQRRFTSDVSHELRTPLTTVRMAADLLFSERQSYPSEVARSAELLQNELDRFENLLTELLEISRFDAGFATLDSELTDLAPVVRRAVDRLAAVCAQAGTEVRVNLPAEPVLAEVDPRRLDRILRNLIGNAVEHGEGRPVDVTLAGDAAAAAIAVRDRGVGLRPGDEQLVFSRFWRADPSRARQTGGTGLGLSISLEDAKLHGGWLEARGAPGWGSQFRLTLPLRIGDRLHSSPLPLPLAPPDAGEAPDSVGAAPAGDAAGQTGDQAETLTGPRAGS